MGSADEWRQFFQHVKAYIVVTLTLTPTPGQFLQHLEASIV